MILIFGSQRKVKHEGEAVASTCPRCHNRVVLHLVEVSNWFTLFFIPVHATDRSKILICPICQWERRLPPRSAAATSQAIQMTQRWRAHAVSDDQYALFVNQFWAGTVEKSAAGH